jgi:predicted dehydrogenase/nucleoside-diphosphate-sugar epimerase
MIKLSHKGKGILQGPTRALSGCHEKPLRVGVVGCGQVARHHLRFIKEVKNAQVVGLADVSQHNAESLGREYGISSIYRSLNELLESTPIDVLHIVTPPELHYEQAANAIQNGIHVLVEKPLTLVPTQADQLYQQATAKGVLVCPDFIQLFNPLFQQAASIVDSGELGRAVHVESVWSVRYNLAEFSRATKLHWSFSLPGGVMQNNLTHPLYQVLFWLGAPNRIGVSPKSYGTLPQGLTDHLHILMEGERCTASIVLSFALQRDCYYLQVFCERGVISIDFYTSSVVVLPSNLTPKFIDRGTFNLRRSWQFAGASLKNVVDVARGNLVPFQGLQRLIPAFYSSIRSSTPPPIAPDLAIAVTKVESQIFSEAGRLHLDLSDRSSRQAGIRQKEKILVTGASGYIGSEVVNKLVKEGFYVRAFVRPLSKTNSLERLGVEIVYGDITDSRTLRRAMEGIDVVMHLAAPLKGPQDFIVRCVVEGTKNVVEAARSSGIKRVIYMSSMSVYDYAKLRDGDAITEKSPLEEQPEQRGAYSLAKREAETIALAHLTDKSPSWTIVRPSMVVGKGSNMFSPAGVKIGNVLLVFGSRSKHLRLVHVEDVARALVEIIQHASTAGRLYTISSAGELTLREYIDRYIRIRYPEIKAIYIPYWCCAPLVRAVAALRNVIGKGPNISMRRLAYLYRDVRVDIGNIVHDVGWRPKQDLLGELANEICGVDIRSTPSESFRAQPTDNVEVYHGTP